MKQLAKLHRLVTDPFRQDNRIDWRLVVVFLAINGLVLANARLHDPRIGYDNRSYFDYVETLATARLVTPQDSREFFSPPLPFSLPALLLGRLGIIWAMKYAQYLNVFLSIGLTWYLLRTCALVEDRSSLRLGALVFLGILPVYYKSFAFVRGEPFVAFFTMIILYYSLRVFLRREFTLRHGVILGLGMGLSAMSRQWGVLFFPSVFLLLIFSWIRFRPLRSSIAKVIAVSAVLAMVVGGWFYLHLRIRHGTFLAFNRKSAPSFSLSNQPPDFYIGLTPRLLFRRPFRPHYANQFIPMLYSEIWGDYWGFFSVSSKDTRSGNHLNGRRLAAILDTGNRPDWLETNYDTMVPYLGNVNLVSFLPSLLAVFSMGFAAVELLRTIRNNGLLEGQGLIPAFLLLSIATIMLGYFWFLIMYPKPDKGDTVKATYILQVFPMVSILVSDVLRKIERRSQALFYGALAMLFAVSVHNLPAMVTQY